MTRLDELDGIIDKIMDQIGMRRIREEGFREQVIELLCYLTEQKALKEKRHDN